MRNFHFKTHGYNNKGFFIASLHTTPINQQQNYYSPSPVSAPSNGWTKAIAKATQSIKSAYSVYISPRGWDALQQYKDDEVVLTNTEVLSYEKNFDLIIKNH